MLRNADFVGVGTAGKSRGINMMQSIKRCKICGSLPMSDSEFNYRIKPARMIYRFYCPKCEVSGEVKHDKHEAEKAWNELQAKERKICDTCYWGDCFEKLVFCEICEALMNKDWYCPNWRSRSKGE